MLFATSFGEAVSNTDPWVAAFFAALPLVVKFLSGKFPALAWMWAIVEKWIPSPPPVDPSKPVDPVVPKDNPLAIALRAAFERLLAKLLKKQEQQQLESFQSMLAEIEAMADKK